MARISKALRVDGERPRRRRFHLETVPVLDAVARLLFALHSLEIAVFAGFYLAVGWSTAFLVTDMSRLLKQ